MRCLNLESNFITGAGVQALVDALRDNDTLIEIKIDNQVTHTHTPQTHSQACRHIPMHRLTSGQILTCVVFFPLCFRGSSWVQR